jgi:nucleotide-binding universal stress UspA family protein
MKATANAAVTTSTTLAIVVGLDFTDADGPAFDYAAQIARRVAKSALHLVHVFGSEPTAERSKELMGHLRLYVDEKSAIAPGLPGVTVGIHLRKGKPVREIVQLAADVHANLIVVGSHKGPHLKQWIVGSTAEKLIAGAPCPVLVASPKPNEPVKHDPVIEPPCPQCVQTRKASNGTRWWCERHAEAANGAHSYSYQREIPFATHDSAVSPTGIDF